MLKQIAATVRQVPPPHLRSIDENSLASAFQMIGAPMHFDPNAEIFGEGEPAEYFYQVTAGVVRTYRVLEDGRRQIGAFHLPGDIFGLEAGDDHSLSAEAIASCTVRVAKRATMIAMAERDGAVAADLWQSTARSLRGAQEHMILLGRKTAEERVVSFLLSLSNRTTANPVIELPMSRQDIADYLGLTIETVSRTFSHLESTSAIELLSSRRVRVPNRPILQRLAA